MRPIPSSKRISPLLALLLLSAVESETPAAEQGRLMEPVAALVADDPKPASATTPSPELANPKIIRYAERLTTQYDCDQNGDLTAEEWASMRGQPARMDRDQDGKVTLAEMISHIVEYNRTRQLGGKTVGSDSQSPAEKRPDAQPDAGSKRSETPANDPSSPEQAASADKPYHVPSRLLPSNLPSWFTERDQNGDGQLSLAEYAPQGGREAVASFTQLDTNHDGLLTPSECTQPKPPNAAKATEP